MTHADLHLRAKWRYEKAVLKVVAYDDRQSQSKLSEGIEVGPKRGLVAKLINTCKSHKKVVTFRPFHSMGFYCFRGLSLWICFILGPICDKYKWICGSSEAAMKRLLSDSFPRNCQFVHVDIENFFMQGSISSLVKAVCSMIGDPALKDVVRSVLTFLLEHQFVESSTKVGAKRVIRGSSMGLPRFSVQSRFERYRDYPEIFSASARCFVVPSVHRQFAFCL